MFNLLQITSGKSFSTPLLVLLCVLPVSLMAACQASTPPQTPTPVTPPQSATPVTPSIPPAAPAAAPVSTDNWVADGIISEGEYQQGKTYNDFSVSWSNDDEYAYIGMKAKTAGWVAIGFGAETLMKNADIIEGAVADGKLTIADMFSTGEFGPHPPDTQLGGTDDVLTPAGKAESGYTTIEFKRKLATGDKFDKPLVKGINKIIWAYSNEPLLTIKHSSRGTGEIELK